MLERITHMNTHLSPALSQRHQIARIVARDRGPGPGPPLIAANHPGRSDAMAILASLGRDDAWIVTANYPFLRAMRLASRRFLFVSDDRSDRLSAFRSIVSRLRSGETVLV